MGAGEGAYSDMKARRRHRIAESPDTVIVKTTFHWRRLIGASEPNHSSVSGNASLFTLVQSRR